jgi:hypothetical protein
MRSSSNEIHNIENIAAIQIAAEIRVNVNRLPKGAPGTHMLARVGRPYILLDVRTRGYESTKYKRIWIPAARLINSLDFAGRLQIPFMLTFGFTDGLLSLFPTVVDPAHVLMPSPPAMAQAHLGLHEIEPQVVYQLENLTPLARLRESLNMPGRTINPDDYDGNGREKP